MDADNNTIVHKMKRIWGSNATRKFRFTAWVFAIGGFGLWMQFSGQLKPFQNLIMGHKNEEFSLEEQEKWNNKIKKDIKKKDIQI